MRLIDRSRVMIAYLGNLGLKDSYKAKYEALAKAIDEAHIIDAELVKHGHWGEYETHPLAHSLDGFPCSACGLHQDDIRGLYYCPNCGAKMDGEVK